MNGYTQINVKKADLLYRRPVSQNESHSLMTNKVHDTNLILLVFLDFKSRGYFNDKICQMKEFTLSQRVYIFNALN